MNICKFFNEWLRMTVGLKEAEKGRLIDAIAYQTTGKEFAPLAGKEAVLLPVFGNLINEKQHESEV